MKLYISHMYSLTTFKVFPKGIQKKVNYVSLRVDVFTDTHTKFLGGMLKLTSTELFIRYSYSHF